jgi:Fe-S-cluster containining protein
MNIPKKWENANILSMSNSEIEDMIEDMSRSNRSVNLPFPFIPDICAEFIRKFHCKNCGKCCIGGADGVFILPDDIQRLSSGMGLSERQFINQFTIVNNGNYFLPFPCPFHDSKLHSCIIYKYRPLKCRLFPFFPSSHITIPQNQSPFKKEANVISINVMCPEGKTIAFQSLKELKDAHSLKKSS